MQKILLEEWDLQQNVLIYYKIKSRCNNNGKPHMGKEGYFEFINSQMIIRPANYSEGVPGHGYGIYECKGKKIAVIDLIGRTDMGVLSENPF